MASAYTEIESKEQFDDMLGDAMDKTVFAFFHASWCGGCKMIFPSYKKIAQATPGSVFIRIDVDENPDITQQCGIEAMPSFLVFKEEALIATLIGPKKAALQELVEKHKT